MRPGSDLAVAQARRKHVAIDRPVDVVLDVFFAAPDELYRTVGLLGYAHGLLDEVDLEPATKPTAEDMIVHGHFFRRQAGYFGRDRLGSRLHLNPDPDLARLGSHVCGAVPVPSAR